MIRNVRRNSKEFKAALSGAENIREFSLGNNFSGSPAKTFPAWVNTSDMQLVATENGYTARVHSNLWFEFEAA